MNPMNPMDNYQPIDQSRIDKDASEIKNMMKKDKNTFIFTIAHRTNRERLAIIDSYKRQFNRDLIKDIKSELSGDFKDTVVALFQDPVTFDCYSLNKAMKGLSTNEDTLIEFYQHVIINIFPLLRRDIRKYMEKVQKVNYLVSYQEI